MSIALRKPMTLDAFLRWEEGQELRHEFDGFRPVAMTGGTVAHESIGGTLRSLLRDALVGSPCKVWGPTLKIEVAAGHIRYPDAFVSCTPPAREATVIKDPVVVFEILSPSTSRIDRITKLQEYQATPSIKRYVILEQDSVAAMVFAREGNAWTAAALSETGILTMPEIGVDVVLAELYQGLSLLPTEDSDTSPTT